MIGVPAGLVVALLVSAAIRYAEWHPPSNDWGNPKDFDGIFFAIPGALVMIPVIRYMRRPVARFYKGGPQVLMLGFLGSQPGSDFVICCP